jgi:hypothetical protein
MNLCTPPCPTLSPMLRGALTHSVCPITMVLYIFLNFYLFYILYVQLRRLDFYTLQNYELPTALITILTPDQG